MRPGVPRNAAMLTIGTGIGGGLIVDGELYRGSTGAAGELGHIVIEADGPPCQGNCPNRGCVESLASGTAIAREGRAAAARAPDSALGPRAAGGAELDGAMVTDAALEGDETARGVLALAGRRIGVALSSLANALDPDVIVIGGGAIRAGELLIGPARTEVRARALRPMNGVRVEAAELGHDAGMIGAATMARSSRRDGLMAGRLTVCPTPIGNVEDLSPRARRALGEADLVACEDTRRAGRLYERLEIDRPRFVSNHEGNEAERAVQLAQQVERGARVVLICDAGTPAISDPGYPLIRACLEPRPRGRGAARAVRGHHGPGGLGPAGPPVALRGVPAAPGGRARAGPALGRDGGGVRVPSAPARLRSPPSPPWRRTAPRPSAAS